MRIIVTGADGGGELPNGAYPVPRGPLHLWGKPGWLELIATLPTR